MMTDTHKPFNFDNVLEALANRHRREFVYSLSLQPYSISQLAAMQHLSLPAIHKHIKILEKAGMIKRRKIGRTNFLTLIPTSLSGLQEWLMQFHTYWGSADGTLENYVQFLSRSKTRKKEK